jgi:hypothetical protein
LVGCCACAATAQIKSASPIARDPAFHLGHWLVDPSAKCGAWAEFIEATGVGQLENMAIVWLMSCLSRPNFPIQFRLIGSHDPPVLDFLTVQSSDHLICSRQDIGRNRQANLLGGFEVNHQLEFCGLLDGYVSRLIPFENLVHLDGDAMK